MAILKDNTRIFKFFKDCYFNNTFFKLSLNAFDNNAQIIGHVNGIDQDKGLVSLQTNQRLAVPEGQDLYALASNQLTQFVFQIKAKSQTDNRIITSFPSQIELTKRRLFDRYVIDRYNISINVIIGGAEYDGVISNISVDGVRANLFDYPESFVEDKALIQVQKIAHLKLVPPVNGKIMNWSLSSIDKKLLVGVYIEEDYPFYSIKKHLNLTDQDIQN